MWLDDMRDPVNFGAMGATWVKNYDEAIALLKTGKVTFASLDHDIGACQDCIDSGKHIGDMKTEETTFFNVCPHAKTGYDVAVYIEEHNIWPSHGMRCHSMNPVGRGRIEQIITRHYRGCRS